MKSEASAARSAVDDPIFRAATHVPFVGPNLSAIREVSLTVDSLATSVMPSLVDVANTLQPARLAPKDGAFDLAPIERISPVLQKADSAVVAMPNTVPVNDSVESLQWMLSPDRDPHVHLLAMPAATQGSLGETLSDYEALARAGAVGFTDDGKPILEDRVMRSALVAAARAVEINDQAPP